MKKLLAVSVVLMFTSAGLQAAAPNLRKVFLSCRNPGSHQDVAKTPIITNTTNHSIAASVKVFWDATDGDKGFVQGPFAINQSKSGLGSAGNAYQCTAYYWVQVP